MNNLIPRVAAVHDLSCFGRCSLTVIIPTLSALGVQVCPLPTAVLSTHLGGFTGLEFCDFTDRLPAFSRHWQQEGVTFDCIYSGFLASERQITIVTRFIDDFSGNRPLVLVDPVMGDDGKLYSTYSPQMQQQMRLLVQKADIITPNFTEACFLLGESYQAPFPEIDRIEDWLSRLSDMGPPVVIITGIPVEEGKIVNAGYDRRNRAFWRDCCDHIPVKYPGTGDIYASVLLGSLLYNDTMMTAMKRAADFITLAINATCTANTATREGVLLEMVLPWLSRNFWQEKNPNTTGKRRFPSVQP